MRVTVITCTHNPRADYFQRVLDALHCQTLALSRWEYLVVDNASAVPVNGAFGVSWHPRARIVCEKSLGLTPARLRGIRESEGELLVFVDDDNVLDPDYLQNALEIAAEKPFLGSWSGQCRPCFEEPPPAWTRRYWGNLVIRQFDRDVWSNLPRLAETMPCGAGLCVRREVAERYVDLHRTGARSFQLDRTGSSLLSGGDNDLAACACDLGLGIGLVNALKLTHLIPPERLTEEYLLRLAEGIHFSATLLDAERGIPVCRRNALGRLIDHARVLCLGRPHSRILQAAYSGRNRAAKLLTTSRIRA